MLELAVVIVLAAAPTVDVSGLEFPEGVQALSGDVSPTGLIVVGTRDSGILLSQDSGKSFYAAANSPKSIRLGQRPARIQAIQAVGESSFLAAGRFGRIFRSDDQGETWAESSSGLSVPFKWGTGSMLFAVDPDERDTVYALVREPVSSEATSVFLARSSDAGRSWVPFKELPSDVTFISLDVRREDVPVLTIAGPSRTIEYRDRRAPFVPKNNLLTREPQRIIPPPLMGHGSDIDVGDVAILFDHGDFVSLNDLADIFTVPELNSVRFTPHATTPSAYQADWFARPAPIDVTGHTPVAAAADVAVSMPLPWDFTFFGDTYLIGGALFVSDNGYLTFGVDDDAFPFESDTRLSQGPPRIAPMWDDLEPLGAGTGVFWFEDTTNMSVSVTWFNMEQFQIGDVNRFQVTFYINGDIEMTWENLDMDDGLMGLSQGTMAPAGMAPLMEANYSVRLPMVDDWPSNTAVYEWFSNEFDTAKIARRFYQCHADAYDQLIIWGQANYLYPTGGSQEPAKFPIAFSDLVLNDVDGIGLDPTLDNTAEYGSAMVLRNIAVLGTTLDYPIISPLDPLDSPPDACRTIQGMDIVGQRVGSQWMSYVEYRDGANMDSRLLLGRNETHWSFFAETDASVMEGNRFQDFGNGTWGGIADFEQYSALDLYLMGALRPNSPALNPFTLFEAFDAPEGAGDCRGVQDSCTAASQPEQCPIIRPTAAQPITMVDVADIIASEGARNPPFQNPCPTLRQAWIMIVPPQDIAHDPTELAIVELYRSEWAGGTADYFVNATQGLCTVDTTLTNICIGGPCPDALPSNDVGNTLHAVHQQYQNVLLRWRDGVLDPPVYALHGTDTKTLLDDTLVGIGSTGMGPAASVTEPVHRDEEDWVDTDGAIATNVDRPSPFFYEVFYRCNDATVFP